MLIILSCGRYLSSLLNDHWALTVEQTTYISYNVITKKTETINSRLYLQKRRRTVMKKRHANRIEAKFVANE